MSTVSYLLILVLLYYNCYHFVFYYYYFISFCFFCFCLKQLEHPLQHVYIPLSFVVLLQMVTTDLLSFSSKPQPVVVSNLRSYTMTAEKVHRELRHLVAGSLSRNHQVSLVFPFVVDCNYISSFSFGGCLNREVQSCNLHGSSIISDDLSSCSTPFLSLHLTQNYPFYF